MINDDNDYNAPQEVTALFDAYEDQERRKTDRCVKQAALRWNVSSDAEEGAYEWIGSRHPYDAAMRVVRKALAEYEVGGDLKLQPGNMRRKNGSGQHSMLDGRITVEARVTLPSAHTLQFDVPVEIRRGRVLVPSVLRTNGETRIIAQQTFDDMKNSATFWAKAPERASIFSPPPDDPSRNQYHELVRPGMFKTSAKRTSMRINYDHIAKIARALDTDEDRARAFYGSFLDGDEQGIVDEAEQMPPSMGTGTCVRAAVDIKVKGRGCRIDQIDSGTEGCIVRDFDGTGQKFLVEFPFRTALVAASDLEEV